MGRVGPVSHSTLSLIAAFAALAIGGTPRGLAQPPTTLSRTELAALLRHQEGLLKSCRCRFSVVQHPTRPEVVSLIEREVSANRLPQGLFPYWTKQASEKSSCVKRWWRKGAKERTETYPHGARTEDSDFRGVTAFDGQIVRKYGYAADGGIRGSVQTIQTSDWEETWPIIQPYDLLFEYFKIPWSRVVSEAPSFMVVAENRDGTAFTRVELKHPKANLDCALTFDVKWRIVERVLFGKPTLAEREPGRDMTSKTLFSGYRSHETGTGEAIWFPHKITLKGYLGRSKDGALINQSVKEIEVSDLDFNLDLPESLFHLEIPRDAVIYDGVTELGFLKPGERPAALFPGEAQRRRWVFAVVFAVLILAVGFFFARRRRVGI